MATTWTDFPGKGRSRQAVSTTATESAPTLATEGLLLSDLNGFQVRASADAGQTFTGTTGNLDAYIWDDLDQAWCRTPELDLTVSTGQVGKRKIAWASFQVQTPRGRIAHVPNGVQVSSGGVTLTYVCSTLYGEQT